MKKDRWLQIESLFHAALELPVARRAGFLLDACQGDEELRRELNSLLSAHDPTFLNQPAYEFAADLFESTATLPEGKEIGPYKIVAPLGAGGMGEVYLAYDDRLRRRVALKLLPADLAHDQQRVRRFAQEARAASKISHPNVCVIHEVGTADDGRHFIAMEYIEGITLRKRISAGGLNLADSLAIAVQVATALAAAHTVGVVHRDVKPENIMIGPQGFIKVLDFGLAKLSRPPGIKDSSHASTLAHTEPGMHMGTIKYMAPEQLREQPVDERADIWSFGVVLHEMFAGATPFEAESRNDTIALILKRQPVELSLDHAPAEFQHIVGKALSKDVSQRYSSMASVVTDLIQMRQKLELGLSGFQDADKSYRPGSDRPLEAKPRPPRKTTSDLWSALSYVSDTAGKVMSGVRRHPHRTILGGFAAIILLAVLGAASSKVKHLIFPPAPPSPSSTGSGLLDIRPLTNLGQSVCATISPDGAVVAHVEKRNGQQRLLITDVNTLATTVLLAAMEVTYRGLVFSKDGNYLYFTRNAGSDAGNLYSGELHQIAISGGPPIKLKDRVDSPITFSPTGDRYAFVRFDRAAGESALIVADTFGTDERILVAPRNERRLSNYGPAWSPNGKTIACPVGIWSKGFHMGLTVFDVDTGQAHSVGAEQWFAIQQVAWLNDETLVISARQQLTRPLKLWRISYPAGEPTAITNDLSDYEGLSLSGEKIVTVRKDLVWRLWIAPNGDAQRAAVINSGVGLRYGLSWIDNTRIVFSSMAGDNLNISAIDADGANQIQLTRNAADNLSPSVTSDGRFVVFASNRFGAFNIWRMNAIDGSDPKQLTFSDGNFYPTCSPDNQWVAYDNQSDAKLTVWKTQLNGGAAQQISPGYARMPVFSRDGQFVAVRAYLDSGRLGIAILPASGGPTLRQLPIPVKEWQQVQWTPDSQALTYIDVVKGVDNIWSYDLRSGARQKITAFNTDQIFAYAWSADFKQLACERGSQVRDVVLITNGR